MLMSTLSKKSNKRFLLQTSVFSSGNRYELVFVLGLTLAATLLRLVQLTAIPPGLHGDEAITAMEARRILEEGPIGPWSPSIHGQPAGPFYWIAFWFLFLPETHFTIRFTTALLGIAAVPVFYLFCRELLGQRATIFGAVALTFSYWAIHFSRTAFPLAAVPVVECAALYFLVRGLRRGQRWAVGLGGVLLGAGLYTYGSYPFLLPLLVIPALLFLIQNKHNKQDNARDNSGLALSWRRLGDLALAGTAALAAAAPFLLFAARSPDAVMGASNVRTITSIDLFQQAETGERVSMLLDRTLHASSVYFRGMQRDFVDGLGLWGLLDPIAGALLAIGFVVALGRFLDWRYSLLVGGLLAGVVPAVLLTPGHMEGAVWAEYRRSIISLPFVFATVGLGADSLLKLAARVFPRGRRPWPALYQGAVAALVISVLASSVLNVHHYFVSWARDDFSRWVFVQDMVQATEFLDSVEARQPVVYFYSLRWSYNYPTRQFLLPDVPGEDRSAEFGTFSLTRHPEHEDRPVIYMFIRPYDRHLDQVVDEYPGGTVTRFLDEDGVIFAAYYLEGPTPVPAGQDAGGEGHGAHSPHPHERIDGPGP